MSEKEIRKNYLDSILFNNQDKEHKDINTYDKIDDQNNEDRSKQKNNIGNNDDNNKKNKLEIINSFQSSEGSDDDGDKKNNNVEECKSPQKKIIPKRFSLFVPDKEIYALDDKKNSLNINMSQDSLQRELDIISYIKYTDTIVFCLLVFSTILQLISNNIYTEEVIKDNKVVKERNALDDRVNALRMSNCGLVFIIWICISVKYWFEIKKRRIQLLACSSDGLISLGLLKYFILELFILSIITPPFLDGKISGIMLDGNFEYSYDTIITICSFSKLYYLIVIINSYSIFHEKSILDLAEQKKVKIGFEFTFKSHLQKSPILMLSLMFLIASFLLMFIMRTVEYGFTNDLLNFNAKNKVIVNNRLKSYVDNYWLTVISMTTVGYGDFYPQTHLGRIVSFISAIIGTLLISLMISFLSSKIEFDPDQRKAYSLIMKNEVKAEMKLEAANAICQLMKIKLSKLNRKKEKTINNVLGNYLNHILILKSFINKSNSLKNFFLPSDKVLSTLDNNFAKQAKFLTNTNEAIEELKTKTAIINREEHNISISYKNINVLYEDLCSFIIMTNEKVKNKELTLSCSDSDVINQMDDNYPEIVNKTNLSEVDDD